MTLRSGRKWPILVVYQPTGKELASKLAELEQVWLLFQLMLRVFGKKEFGLIRNLKMWQHFTSWLCLEWGVDHWFELRQSFACHRSRHGHQIKTRSSTSLSTSINGILILRQLYLITAIFAYSCKLWWKKWSLKERLQLIWQKANPQLGSGVNVSYTLIKTRYSFQLSPSRYSDFNSASLCLLFSTACFWKYCVWHGCKRKEDHCENLLQSPK